MAPQSDHFGLARKVRFDRRAGAGALVNHCELFSPRSLTLASQMLGDGINCIDHIVVVVGSEGDRLGRLSDDRNLAIKI